MIFSNLISKAVGLTTVFFFPLCGLVSLLLIRDTPYCTAIGSMRLGSFIVLDVADPLAHRPARHFIGGVGRE
jgi:hypothetical protein